MMFAQFGGYGRGGQTQSIRATIRGGGSSDSGKCTAELEVDGAAEVSISGDTGRVRTVSGQPAVWRRLDCTSPMPSNVSDFRFTGVDGRGSQNLLRDPRQNRGVAVVRLDDPQGGREGYTFDIEWGGGNGYYGNPSASGPYSDGGYNGRDRHGERDRYNDRGRYSDNSGWGDNPNNGYGNRAYDGGGWNNGWGNTITYRGQGRGQFAMARGQGYRIYGADVNVDRSTGRVQVNLDSDMGRDALSFVGRIQQVTGDTIIADVRAAGNNQGNVAGANGLMRIQIRNNRRVNAISMDGNVAGGGGFRLNWQD